MEDNYFQEMCIVIDKMIACGKIENKNIFLFGYCEMSCQMLKYLNIKGYSVKGILDNNINKQGDKYMGVKVYTPIYILKFIEAQTIVLIASRAYEEMKKKLIQIGYNGECVKVVDYNTFEEYSLSKEVYEKKYTRMQRGMDILTTIKIKNKGKFLFICPYKALGDVYYAMAYLPYFLKSQRIEKYIVVLVGKGCSSVAKMFIQKEIIVLTQNEMDELVQAILYTGDKQEALIIHHDRPYTNDMTRFIDIGKLTFVDMYCCGIYGLKRGVNPYSPTFLQEFSCKGNIKKGKSIIISPYAKSVVGIPLSYWHEIVTIYLQKGFEVYTNVVDSEKALANTIPLTIPIEEMVSAVEYAGYFVGVRSGLCDVITTAHCEKTVVFPDVYYSITQTKVCDFFKLEGWKSINVNLKEYACTD